MLREALGELYATSALAPRWPVALGFRLYCALLEATFEADEPAELASDRGAVLALLARTWPALGVDAASHELADHRALRPHQQCGAPQLLPRPNALDAVEAPAGPFRPAAGAGAGAREQQPVRRGAGGERRRLPAGRAPGRGRR